MDISFILTGVILIILVYLFNKYFIQIYDYWRKRGIPTVAGAIPFIGHTITISWFHRTFACFCDEIYRNNKGRSMIGFYQFRRPNLMLLDPELVKTVLISDFSKFHVNVLSVDAKVDPLLAQNPFCNDGEKWKTTRNRLSYALMSSKRLRILCHTVTKVCDKFTKYLRENVEKSKICVYEVETKELGNRFTGEVVASAGFGVEGDFFSNGTGPNSFRETVYGFLEPSFFNIITQSIIFFVPFLSSILRISYVPKRMDRFFRRVIHEMIGLRRKDGTSRNDFLQLMLNNSENDDGVIDEEGITASATSFFLDGYETSAVTMSFFLYQIAENPKAQEKLRREIKTILERHNGEINYESLGEMTYMDQALNESMRLYPVVGFLQKKCNEPCKLVGKDGLECLIEPGTEIILPLHAMQKDSEYWENPEIYEPDRFSEEHKRERPKTVFLPFGEGPRICVGMRFATMQIKGAVAAMLKDFVIEVSPRTKRPLELKRGAILTTIEGGLWINLRPL